MLVKGGVGSKSHSAVTYVELQNRRPVKDSVVNTVIGNFVGAVMLEQKYGRAIGSRFVPKALRW